MARLAFLEDRRVPTEVVSSTPETTRLLARLMTIGLSDPANPVRSSSPRNSVVSVPISEPSWRKRDDLRDRTLNLTYTEVE